MATIIKYNTKIFIDMIYKKTINLLENIICEELDVNIEDFKSKKITTELNTAREICAYIMYNQFHVSINTIAIYFNITRNSAYVKLRNFNDKINANNVMSYYYKLVNSKFSNALKDMKQAIDNKDVLVDVIQK